LARDLAVVSRTTSSRRCIAVLSQGGEPVPERVVVAMSGGVDSSVAAALLHQQGYDVIGMTMKLWEGPSQPQSRHKTCCTLDDVSDARRVAAQLGIPFFVANFKAQFAAHVIDYFTTSYLQGQTPNPCVQCNRYLKFTHLLHRAQQLGARWVATGHYASVQQGDDGRYYVRRGRDGRKDQSYFLFDLSQEQLAQALLPLGQYHKDDVRQLAAQLGLSVAEKAESQEICFIPDGDYRAFLRPRLDPEAMRPGPIVSPAGDVLGEHQGLPFYTVGQRRGLGIAAGQPLYVSDVQPAHNTLVVGSRQEALSEACEVERVCWSRVPPVQALSTTVQIRYRHQPVAATVYPVAADRARIVFQEPQFAVTPGQAAVFYAGDSVIGGGWISRAPADA
jgi:tRNA-specific 2-thiouridylase